MCVCYIGYNFVIQSFFKSDPGGVVWYSCHKVVFIFSPSWTRCYAIFSSKYWYNRSILTTVCVLYNSSLIVSYHLYSCHINWNYNCCFVELPNAFRSDCIESDPERTVVLSHVPSSGDEVCYLIYVPSSTCIFIFICVMAYLVSSSGPIIAIRCPFCPAMHGLIVTLRLNVFFCNNYKRCIKIIHYMSYLIKLCVT